VCNLRNGGIEREIDREREEGHPVHSRKVGALALTSRCCRCYKVSILPVPALPVLPFLSSPPRERCTAIREEFLRVIQIHGSSETV